MSNQIDATTLETQTINVDDNQLLEFETVASKENNTKSESGGIASIGIDGSALIFQIVNFVILFILLRKFLFLPVAKVLESRRKTIEESMESAKQIEKQRENWQQEYQKLVKEMQEKQNKILNDAKKSAEKLKKDMAEETRKDQESIIENAKVQIDSEKEKSINEIKEKIVGLVGLAVEKVTKNTVDSNKDKEIIKKSIKETL